MSRPLRLVFRLAAALLALAVLSTAAFGTWLYVAARHKGAPDNVVPNVEYPDPTPLPSYKTTPRYRTALVGDTWEILDRQGRVMKLRGVNVGQGGKVPPWQPIEKGDTDAFRQLHDWGFNAIRLIVTWEALEPTPGGFNLEHLAYIRWFLDTAQQHGIVVILDNHHNEVSRCFGGDMAPPWAHRPGVVPQEALDKDCRYMGWPGLAELPRQLRWWADFFDGLWTPDRMSLQDHMIWSWQRLAEVVRGHPALLGYGPLNEAHCYAGWFAGVFHPMAQDCEAALSDYYRRFAKAIKDVDADALIFFEPPLKMLAPDWDGKDSAVVRPPVDGAVFSVHYYNGAELEATCDWTWRRDDCRLAEFLEATGELAADRFEAPRVLTEYGVHPCKAGALQDLQHQAVDIEDQSASAFVWNYWKHGETWGMTAWREGGEDMSLVVPEIYASGPAEVGTPRCVASALVRPYPMRVAGSDVRWSFDRSFQDWDGRAADTHHDGRPVTNTDVFTLTFRQGEGSLDTYVWVPRRLVYGDDPSTEAPEFTIDVSDGQWRWATGEPDLVVWSTNPKVAEHRMTITPWGGRRAPGDGVGTCVPR